MSLTPSQAIDGIAIEAVPTISTLLNIEPRLISVVPEGSSEEIRFSVSVPPDFALGYYEGTVHVRRGNRTIPAPLRVSLLVRPLGLSIREIADDSSLVAVASVLSVESAFNDAGTDISTTVRLLPLEIVKGTAESSPISLLLPGGVVGRVSALVPGTPSFTVGETVLLFLDGSATPGDYSAPDGALGVFHIETNPATGEQTAIVDEGYRSSESKRLRGEEFADLLSQSADGTLLLEELLDQLRLGN